MYATLIPMQIIDGRLAKQYYIPKLMERIKGLSFIPKLAIIQIGNRPDSDSYIKANYLFINLSKVTTIKWFLSYIS